MSRAADRRLTPEQLAEKQRIAKKTELEKLRLVRCMNEVFGSHEGMVVLRFLKNTCGYQRTSIVGNPQTGEINDKATLYNEVRRGIYLELRKYIHTETLTRVELDEKDIEDFFE